MTRFKKCDNDFCNNIIKPPYNILRLINPEFGGHKIKKDVGYGTIHINNRREKRRLCDICYEAEKDMGKEHATDPILDWSPEPKKIIAEENMRVLKDRLGQ